MQNLEVYSTCVQNVCTNYKCVQSEGTLHITLKLCPKTNVLFTDLCKTNTFHLYVKNHCTLYCCMKLLYSLLLYEIIVLFTVVCLIKINVLRMVCAKLMYFEGCVQNQCASKVVCKFNVLRRLFAKSMCFECCV